MKKKKKSFSDSETDVLYSFSSYLILHFNEKSLFRILYSFHIWCNRVAAIVHWLEWLWNNTKYFIFVFYFFWDQEMQNSAWLWFRNSYIWPSSQFFFYFNSMSLPSLWDLPFFFLDCNCMSYKIVKVMTAFVHFNYSRKK